MGILNKLFGKDTNNKQSQVQSDLKNFKNQNPYSIYPVLKPGDWTGPQLDVIYHVKIGTIEKPHLIVGFAYNAPGNLIFEFYKDRNLDQVKALVAEAYENLDTFEVHMRQPMEYKKKIIDASGTDFSAEKILSQSFMSKAHETLKSEELIVSIPRRTQMRIASMSISGYELQEFYRLHNQGWHDESENAPILNVLFVVKNGIITGAKTPPSGA